MVSGTNGGFADDSHRAEDLHERQILRPLLDQGN
jgi:hypothetical protein